MTLPERLTHLPDRKRRELEHAAQVLFGEFDDSLKTKLSEKGRRGRILKLILFGSYARGDWVEDRKSGYSSDYDLLVVVNYGSFAEQYEAWEKAAERFLQELTITRRLSTPVNFIVHTLTDFNDQLTHGRPFFVDIARDGIVLYELPGYPLASPKTLAPEEARAEAHGISTIGYRTPRTVSSWPRKPLGGATTRKPLSICITSDRRTPLSLRPDRPDALQPQIAPPLRPALSCRTDRAAAHCRVAA